MQLHPPQTITLKELFSAFSIKLLDIFKMSTGISFSTWNINGIFSKVLGDKTKNKDFTDSISKVDFIFITETWTNTCLNIPGFEVINSQTAKPVSNQACRQSGGISLLFKTKFKKYVSIIKNTKNFLWSKISKEILNSDQDLYICGAYIPPEKSNYFENEIFEELENDLILFSSKAHIILLGDLNARTSKLEDFISSEGSDHIKDTSNNSFYPPERQNIDSITNNHGKKIIEICKSTDMRILNGRTNGDSLGRPSFHGKNGTSLVDYIICNQNLMTKIKHLVVKSPNYLSDHSQVIAWTNLHKTTDIINNAPLQPPLSKLPLQYIWNNESSENFKKVLKTDELQEKINAFLDKNFTPDRENINDCVNEFQNIINLASKRSLKIKKKKFRRKISNVANKKWFDKDCRFKRHHLRKLANQKHRDPNNIEIRDMYHATLKDYKATLEMKKKNFHSNKIEELENARNDPLLFWKTLTNISEDLDSNEIKKTPQPSEWLTHFEALHSEHKLDKEQNEILECLKTYDKIKENLTELDYVITEDELLIAAKKLKSKKAVYNDKISNEMIKSSIGILSKAFLKIFNNILTSGKFPESWTEGLITPIYKSGNSLDPSNYRGICVSSCMGKLFCSILNNRLMNFANEKKLIHPTQIGFMPGNRTADHILTLKTLHDKYIKHNDKEKIYACFVDFRKAFDSVWQQGMFYQLIKNNIGGRFYDLIQDLYSSTKCAIKLSENRTPFFPYKKGVRQGCILSPLLFNIYINDLPKLFEQTQSDPFLLPNGTTINSLLYADDLVIFSRSKSGLQNCLNKLHEWCNRWLMEVNIKKTKIMIFQKYNSKLPNLHFYIGNKKIDIVEEYTYLGLKLVPNGKFKLAQKQLSEKGLHALYKTRKHLDFHKLSPKIATKIFDSIIAPILLYNSEVWGAYEKNDLNKWDNSETEKIHLRF